MAEENKEAKEEVVTAGEDAVEKKETETPAEETKKANGSEPKAETAPKKTNYVYAALLLHSSGKEITEANLKKVVDATGEKSDDAMVKALVSSLEGVDIDDAINQAVAVPAAAAAPAGEAPKEEKKAEESEEQKEKKAEEAAAGLSSLFG